MGMQPAPRTTSTVCPHDRVQGVSRLCHCAHAGKQQSRNRKLARMLTLKMRVPDDAGGIKALPSDAEQEGHTTQLLLFVELAPSKVSKS